MRNILQFIYACGWHLSYNLMLLLHMLWHSHGMMELAKWYKIILFGNKCIIIFFWKENIPIETILYCYYSWFSLIIRFGVTVVTHVITTLTWKKANNIKYILLSQYTTSKMKVEHVICMRELYFFGPILSNRLLIEGYFI